MEWDSLSSEAKRILSLIKDPVTGDYHLDANIFVQLGAMFENGEVKEMITPEVFEEIVSFTRDDDKIMALGNCDGELLISIKK